jgi:hypothetical protein
MPDSEWEHPKRDFGGNIHEEQFYEQSDVKVQITLS